MDDNQLLDLCLGVTGRFEGGAAPSYSTLAGDSDGQGISGGVLQWCAGQGTLQTLVRRIGDRMGWEKAASYFQSDIKAFSETTAAGGVLFAHAHYLDPANRNRILPGANVSWKDFLATPEGVAEQRELAQSTVLAHAKRLAALYTPEYAGRTRPIAFFFDVCTQQGSMGTIPAAVKPDPATCLTFAQNQDELCAAQWREASSSDPLAAILLYYAYERARLARPQYVWSALSRRGTIAARKGIVNKSRVDLTGILD